MSALAGRAMRTSAGCDRRDEGKSGDDGPESLERRGGEHLS